MRNTLYTLGILVTLIGVVTTYSELPSISPNDMAIVVAAHAAIATQRMLIVVCGAVVHAIERVERVGLAALPPSLPPPQWFPPPGGPPMGPG
jgi:hypothetical protein